MTAGAFERPRRASVFLLQGKDGEYVRRENDFAVAMEAAGFQRIQPKGKYHYITLPSEKKQQKIF